MAITAGTIQILGCIGFGSDTPISVETLVHEVALYFST